MCSPPSQRQPPSPASGASPLPLPHANDLPALPAAPELPGKSSLRCPWRAREPLQLLHRHSACELLTVPGSSPPSCPAHRTVPPRVRRASLSPPPSRPSSHFLFASYQPFMRSSLCASQPSAATNTSLGQRANVLQTRGPTLLPVIAAPCDRVSRPTDKAGQETLPNVPLNGHPEAVGSVRSQGRSVVRAFLLRLGAAPTSQLPAIARPPGSWGQAPSLSSLPPRPPQHCYQPVSHYLPLPPPYAAGPEVTMPRRTLPYMTSSAISHLRKY
ncbi:ena/VASP-like protein [Cyrtonyx montezumae]|uniref:ena/VASP-like protein n=1 Tax=Cyrtonyx montezumae TaxID=9017 RepID=UPI0032DAC5AB